MEADFHREYGIKNLTRETTRQTWRWLMTRIGGLSSRSAWSYLIWPVDPATGERYRATPPIEDPEMVEAFFRREGAA